MPKLPRSPPPRPATRTTPRMRLASLRRRPATGRNDTVAGSERTLTDRVQQEMSRRADAPRPSRRLWLWLRLGRGPGGPGGSGAVRPHPRRGASSLSALGACSAERIECNVLATVFMERARWGLTRTPPRCWRTVSPTAMRCGSRRSARHPWPLLASPLESGAEEFVELWLEADPDLDSVSSVPATAQAIASAWERADRRHGSAHHERRHAHPRRGTMTRRGRREASFASRTPATARCWSAGRGTS